MDDVEYIFQIDVFTPENIPMARLAQYMAGFAKVLGHAEHTHFVNVERGSARLRARVEMVDAPKVESRLASVSLGKGPKDAAEGRRQLEDLLANDNAVGDLLEASTGRIVIPFLGRDRPKPLVFPPFREDTSIEGQLVNIGGRDTTAHATLQSGANFHTNVSMDRAMARELAPLLYGPVLRLHGNGRFERGSDGRWRMLDFRTDRFEALDGRPLHELLTELRSISGNSLMEADAYQQIVRDRADDEDSA